MATAPATTSRPQLVNPGEAAKPPKPIDIIRHSLDQMTGELTFVLPQHIPVDRFKRVVLTAINSDEKLLTADRKSLFGACMKAAQDGLLPDKREGALVIFNTKVKNAEGKDTWINAVQWMPMVYGIIKKMRNSGELASIVAHEVYQKDHFKYILGDEERIEHEPYMGDVEPGKMIAVYAIARLKDGTIQREVMTRAQVDKVRSVSKSKDNGPWVAWYEEMARKTVVRRLSKYLPMSTEIEDMLRRDDALFASQDTVAKIGHNGGPALEVANTSSPLIEGESRNVTSETVDSETGEVTEENADVGPAAEDPRFWCYGPDGKPTDPPFETGEAWKVRLIEFIAVADLGDLDDLLTHNGVTAQLVDEGTKQAVIEAASKRREALKKVSQKAAAPKTAPAPNMFEEG